MEIEERRINGVTILDLRGTLTIGNGGEVLLREEVEGLAALGTMRMVLNLADVPSMDSAGLGQMIHSYSQMGRQGGKLKLLHLTNRVNAMLTATRLIHVFEIFESEAAAVRSFR